MTELSIGYKTTLVDKPFGKKYDRLCDGCRIDLATSVFEGVNIMLRKRASNQSTMIFCLWCVSHPDRIKMKIHKRGLANPTETQLRQFIQLIKIEKRITPLIQS